MSSTRTAFDTACTNTTKRNTLAIVNSTLSVTASDGAKGSIPSSEPARTERRARIAKVNVAR